MGGKSGGEVQVTEYRMSMHMGVCTSADALTGLYYGQKVMWEGEQSAEGGIAIDVPDLFGGIKAEGGVGGTAYWLPGGSEQVLPDGLAARFGLTGATCPGFRGLASVFFVGQQVAVAPGSTEAAELAVNAAVNAGVTGYGGGYKAGFYWAANNPYLRDIWMRVRRTPKGMSSELQRVPTPSLRASTNRNAVTVAGQTETVTQGLLADIGGVSVLLDGMSFTLDGTEIVTDVEGDTITLNGVEYDLNMPTTTMGAVTVTVLGTYTSGGETIANIDVRINARYDANPAAIIYECLTNGDWGMGASSSAINTASFTAAAETLLDEDFGLSMMWTQQNTIEAFVGEILDHIQGVLYINPRDGLFTLTLIRDDYDRDTLPELNPDNCQVVSFQRKGFTETINEVVVTWTNPLNEQEETVSVQDLANISIQGPVSDSRNYYGVRTAQLAMKLANRDLRNAAAPLASFEIKANRTAWDFVPGGVVKLTYPEYGIDGVVLRIGKIDYGKPGASTISINAMEDVFGTPAADYTVPQQGQWIDPSQPPEPVTAARIITTPYWLAEQVVDISTAEYPDVLAAVLAAPPNDDADSYELVTETIATGGETVNTALGINRMLSYVTLLADLDQEASSLIAGFPNIKGPVTPTVGTFLFLGDVEQDVQEIAQITFVDGSGFQIARGLLDTTPKAWEAGTKVWIADTTSALVDITKRLSGETVAYRLLTRTSKGMLAIADAPEIDAELDDRPWRPNRPGNVKVETTAFGTFDAFGLSSFTVTWNNRNRLLEPTTPTIWTYGEVTPEDGQTTTINALTMDGTLIDSVTGLTGTSYEVDVDLFDGEIEGYLEVKAERDGIESLQGHRIFVQLDDPRDHMLFSGDEAGTRVRLSGISGHLLATPYDTTLNMEDDVDTFDFEDDTPMELE